MTTAHTSTPYTNKDGNRPKPCNLSTAILTTLNSRLALTTYRPAARRLLEPKEAIFLHRHLWLLRPHNIYVPPHEREPRSDSGISAHDNPHGKVSSIPSSWLQHTKDAKVDEPPQTITRKQGL